MGESKKNVRETLVEKASRMTAFDKAFGVKKMCGVDEAGRGPLVGPVSVCACSLPLDIPILGIDDSKKLSEKKREMLYEQIVEVADFCVIMIDAATIDEINILNATKLAMSRAIAGLKETPELAVIDAVKGIDTPVRCEAVIKGDAKSYSVAAASIIAKVTRDRYMRELDVMYPQYGFCRNKGYGTKEHISAIKLYGACPEHRRTFIKNFTVGE